MKRRQKHARRPAKLVALGRALVEARARAGVGECGLYNGPEVEAYQEALDQWNALRFPDGVPGTGQDER